MNLSNHSRNPFAANAATRAMGRILPLAAAVLMFLTCPEAGAAKVLESASPDVIEAGIPPFTIYSSESFGLQTPPFDLNELPDGRILVVGASELVVGDGVRWELLEKSREESGYLAGRVSIDDSGGIWASQTDGFCKVEFDSQGKWRFGKAIPLPDHAKRQWPAFILNRRINGQDYWFGPALVAWTAGTHEIPRILSTGFTIDHIFPLAGKLYATSPNSGNVLRVLPDGTCSTLFGAEHNNPSSSILCSASLDSGQVLVGTVLDGVRIFDGTQLKPLCTTGPLSGGARISDLCRAPGLNFAAAVDAYGIVFFNKDGRILQTLDRSIDHRFGQVKRLLRRSDGSLWALFSRGIIRIEFPSRISYVDPMLSSGADYVEPVRHQGRLWLLTTGKVVRALYEEKRMVGFEPDSPPSGFVYTLESLEGRLIACCVDGIFERTSEGWIKRNGDISNARIVNRSKTNGKWLYAARGEIGWMDLRTEQPGIERIPTPELQEVYNSILDNEGNAWLELGSSSVARITFPQPGRPAVRIFTQADGIAGGWAEIFVIDETLRINSSGRTLRFVPGTQRFEPDPDISKRYPELLGSIGGRPTRDSQRRLWVPRTDHVKIVDDSRPGDRRRVESLPAELKPGAFICEPNGIVWMQERLRFARYDPSSSQPEVPPIAAIITRVELPSTGLTHVNPGSTIPAIQPDDNTLIAHFAASSVPFGERVTFEFMIEGMNERWAPAGVVGSTLLNRLKEGSYTLRVRPMSIAGPGREATLKFVVLPPWYRTYQAYAGYLLLSLGLISAAVLIPLYAERRQKALLSMLVTERTRELSASEERFRSLNAELEGRVAERTRELDQVAARLRVANQELESFSYSVSHDLRAPLRNITGFIELMSKKIADGKIQECMHPMEVVVAEAKRMASLIEDLLIFSRLARSEMRNECVDLKGLVEDCRRELAQETENRSIEWDIAPLIPVCGDATLLRQVIANLVGNAVKFTRMRPNARIEVYCDPAPDQEGFVNFHVKDNGAGFNPKYGAKLFNVFQRLHSAKDFEGTGIGLANVKRIITRHGGQVRAEGQPDRGATFSFSLKPWTEPPKAPTP